MDYSILTNQELQREIWKICKAYSDRQDFKSHKSSGAKERLYNILKNDYPEATHEQRLLNLQHITTFDFLKKRNAGLTALSRAIYELEEIGLTFKNSPLTQ